MFSEIIESLQARSPGEIVRYLDKGGLENLQKVFRENQHLATSEEDFRALVLAIMHAYNSTNHGSAKILCHDVEAAYHQELRQLNPARAETVSLFYHLLYCLHWCVAASTREMAGFDERVLKPSIPYIDHLCRANFWVPVPRRARKEAKVRIGYLCALFYESDGNAISSLEYSIFSGHQALNDPDVEIIVYAWLHSSPAFVQKVRALGLTVRVFSELDFKTRLQEIRLALCEDRMDALITDMNFDVPAILFQSRVAPLQIYYQLGMPYWSVPGIDAVFAGWHGNPETFGFKPEKTFPITAPQHPSTLLKEYTADEIQKERGKFPPTPWIVGTFSRLAKITPSYMEIVKGIVEARADVTVVIGGTGGQEMIQSYIDKNNLKGRVILVPEYVDGKLWSCFLDVFLDTFPTNGGNACREVLARHKPIIHMTGSDMPNLQLERDPALVATTNEEYVRIAVQLLSDEEARGRARKVAQALYEKVSDFKRGAIEITATVKKLLGAAGPEGDTGSASDEIEFRQSCRLARTTLELNRKIRVIEQEMRASFHREIQALEQRLNEKHGELSEKTAKIADTMPRRLRLRRKLKRMFARFSSAPPLDKESGV